MAGIAGGDTMTEPTEYQLMKKYLYARKDFDSALDGTQVNAII